MSLNDPRWGGQGGQSGDGDRDRDRSDGQREGNRGNNQGPPDLEEVWREFNQRLSGMFGGKRQSRGPGGSGGGGGPQLPNFSFNCLTCASDAKAPA